MADQKSFSTDLIKQIQDINGNPAFTALEKSQAIANLKGATRESMMDFLNKNFRTGPGLSKNVAKAVSEDRQSTKKKA